MKRSEMVILLANEIDEFRIDFNNDYMTFDDHTINFASKILNKLEEVGILPPQIKLKDPGQFPGDAFEYYMNEWEDEETTPE